MNYESRLQQRISGNCSSYDTCIICKKPNSRLQLGSIDVNCDRNNCTAAHYYLFLIVPPFHGSTALEGLLSSSNSLSNLCGTESEGVRHVPRCEGQTVLRRAGLLTPRNRWEENKPSNWKAALREYSKYWNMSKCVLMDKSPPNVVKVKQIAQQLRKAGKQAVFIFMTRSPCFMSQTMRSTEEKRELSLTADYNFLDTMMKSYRYLLQNRYPVIHLRYEDMLASPALSARRISRFMPCLGKLDPSRPQILASGDRALSLTDYAASHPIAPVFPRVSKEFFEVLHFFGYV